MFLKMDADCLFFEFCKFLFGFQKTRFDESE